MLMISEKMSEEFKQEISTICLWRYANTKWDIPRMV